MTEYAGRLASAADTAARVRQFDTIGMASNGALQARAGVRPDGGGVVSVVSGTMGVQVTAFSGWVDGGASVSQGGYPFVCDATKALTLDDGDAALSRTDTIVARVQDDTYDGSGTTAAAVVVVKGTPGAGAPALPTNSIPLRDVIVPAGMSAGTGGLSSGDLSTDRRTYTAALGGIIPVTSATQRDAIASPQEGLAVYRQDTNQLQVYNGTGWDTYRKDSGLATLRGTKAMTTDGSSAIAGTVTFSTAFSGVPTVVASISNPQQRFYAQAYDVTATGCTVRAVDRDASGSTGVAADVSWIAIGPA